MLSKAFFVIASALALALARPAYAADAAAPWQGAGGPVIEAPIRASPVETAVTWPPAETIAVVGLRLLQETGALRGSPS